MASLAYCSVRDALLDRLCVATCRYSDAASQLVKCVRQDPEFAKAQANVHEHARLARDLRADYNEHKREHGC